MNSKCNIFVAWVMMIVSSFYGDIFSAAVQITVRTALPLASGSVAY
jgi:hypothetical protein